MARRPAVALVVLATAVLLSGCMRLSTEVRVADDGSGTFRALVALDRATYEGVFGDLAAASPLPTPDELAAQLAGSLPGATVTPYADGGFEGSLVSVPFSDPAQLVAILAAADAGTGRPTFTDPALEPAGAGWRFSVTVAGGTGGLTGGTDDLLTPEQVAVLEQSLVYEFSLALPGRVVEHDADRVTADGTLVWDLTGSDGTRTLTARSEPGEPAVADGAPSLVAAAAGAAPTASTAVDATTAGSGDGTTEASDGAATDDAADGAGSGAGQPEGDEQAADAGGDDDGGFPVGILVAVVVAVAVVVGVVLVLRSRRRSRAVGPYPGYDGGFPPPAPPVPSPFGAGAPDPHAQVGADGHDPWSVPTAAPPAAPRWTPPPAPAPGPAPVPTSGPEADPWAAPPVPPGPDVGATRVLPTWDTDPDARAPVDGPASDPPPPPPPPAGPVGGPPRPPAPPGP